MIDNLTLLSPETFSSFTSTNDCLVIFFKDHCPNCKVLMKVLEKCLTQHPDLIIAGVNTEDNQSLMEDVAASKVPTVIVYKDGKSAARKSGIMNPTELMSFYFTAGVQ